MALPYLLGLLGLAPAAEEIRLDWTAPAGCPSGEEVLARARAGLSEARPSPFEARVVVIEGEETFRLEATLRTAQGESRRQLEAATCEELADATALLIVLTATQPVEERTDGVPPAGPASAEPGSTESGGAASDSVPPPASRQEPTPSDGASELASTPSETSPRASAPSTRPPPAGSSLEARAGLLAGVAGLAVPAATGWLAAQGGLGGRGWEVAVGARYWIGRPVPLERGAEGRFDLVHAQLEGCGVPSAGPLEFPLCLALTAGAARGRGTQGLIRAKSAVHPWVGASASAALRWWFAPHWGVTARFDAMVAIARPRFEIGGIGEICCDAGGLAGSLGVVGRWGRNTNPRGRTITRHAGPRAPSR